MRDILLLGFFLGTMAVDVVQGQTSPMSKPTTALSMYDSRFWSNVPLSRQSASGTRRVHYCCNLKHALIGAGIGAAIGFAFVRGTCDASDCTIEYIKSMTVMGGILGGLGAFVSRENPGVPLAPPILGERMSPLQLSKRGDGSFAHSWPANTNPPHWWVLSNGPLQPTGSATQSGEWIDSDRRSQLSGKALARQSHGVDELSKDSRPFPPHRR